MTGFGYSVRAAVIMPESPEVTLQPIQHFGGWYLLGDISVDWEGLGTHAIRGNRRYRMG